MLIDARIPVHFTSQAPAFGQADQVLLLPADEMEGPRTPRCGLVSRQGWAAVLRLPSGPAPHVGGHDSGCACCVARPSQADPLTRLFQARARGEIGFFRSLVASLPGPEADSLRAALVSDPFLYGRFVQAA